MKTCNSCQNILPLEDFYYRKDRESYRSQCKQCFKKSNLNFDRKERRKSTYRYTLRTKYGLNEEDFNKLYLSQEGKCCICKQQLANIFMSTEGLLTNLDHCHITNKIRNILCMQCNAGLGNFKDNLIYLDNAKKYLEKHNNRH